MLLVCFALFYNESPKWLATLDGFKYINTIDKWIVEDADMSPLPDSYFRWHKTIMFPNIVYELRVGDLLSHEFCLALASLTRQYQCSSGVWAEGVQLLVVSNVCLWKRIKCLTHHTTIALLWYAIFARNVDSNSPLSLLWLFSLTAALDSSQSELFDLRAKFDEQSAAKWVESVLLLETNIQCLCRPRYLSVMQLF